MTATESQPDPAPRRPPLELLFLALLFVQAIFGVNYITSKVVIAEISPLIWAGFRMGVSAACMVLVAWRFGGARPRFTFEFLRSLFVFSLLGVAVNQEAFLLGLKHTTVANSSILNTLVPMLTLGWVGLMGFERIRAPQVAGFVLAFAGVLTILQVERLTIGTATLKGDLLTIGNAVSFSLFVSFGRGFLQKHDALWSTALLFVFGSVFLLFFSIPDWAAFTMPPLTPKFVGSALYGIFAATLVTYFLNTWTLRHLRSSDFALFMYFQPLLGSVLAWWVFGEAITLRTVLAALLIFSGVFLGVVWKTRDPARRR